MRESREYLNGGAEFHTDPISLPENPIKNVAITLGKDELIALGINASGTAALAMVSSNPLLLATSGPIIEKAGLFVSSFKETIEIYKTTTPEDRKQKGEYIKDALKNGMPSFWRDLLGHDPVYTTSLLTAMNTFPDTPAWMLSMITFVGAIGVVSVEEVARAELAYKGKKHSLKRLGFTEEPHIEAKFRVETDDRERLIADLAKELNLGEVQTSHYNDRYFPNTKLREYNGRNPRVRIRKRTSPTGEPKSQTAQVIYTRASQVPTKQKDQFNYFPRNKDKFKLVLDDDTQSVLERLIDTSIFQDIFVSRDYAAIPGGLFVSVDSVTQGDMKPFAEIELKTFRKNKPSVQELITAMRHIMRRYDVVHTTQSRGSEQKRPA